jgi:hypothetical protein
MGPTVFLFLSVWGLLISAQNPPDFIKTHWDGSTAGCSANANTYFLESPRWYSEANISADISPFTAGDLDSTGISLVVKVPFIPSYQTWFLFSLPVGALSVPTTTTCNTASNLPFLGGYFTARNRWNNQTLAQQVSSANYPFGNPNWAYGDDTTSAGLSSPYWTAGVQDCDIIKYTYRITFAQIMQCGLTDSASYVTIQNYTDANGKNGVSVTGKIQALSVGKYYNFATQDWDPTYSKSYVSWTVFFTQGTAIASTSPSAFINFRGTTTQSDVQGAMKFCTEGVFSIPNVNRNINDTSVYLHPDSPVSSDWINSQVIYNSISESTGVNHYFSVCVTGTCKYGVANCSGPIQIRLVAQNATNGYANLGYEQTIKVNYHQVVNPVSLVTRWKISTSALFKQLPNGTAVYPTIWQDGDVMLADNFVTTLDCTGAAANCVLAGNRYTTTLFSAAICGSLPVITGDEITGCYVMEDYASLVSNGVVSTDANVKGYYSTAVYPTNNWLVTIAFKARLYMFSSTKNAYLKAPTPKQYLHLVVNVVLRDGSSKRSHIVRAVDSDDIEEFPSSQTSFAIRDTTDKDANHTTTKNSGLTPGAVVGIIVGTTVGGIAVFAGCYVLFGAIMRLRKPNNRRGKRDKDPFFPVDN